MIGAGAAICWIVPRLCLRLPSRRIRLHRRHRRDIGLTGHRRACRCGLGAALQQLQAILELAVAVFQLLVLAGELPQPILELLNAHLRIDIVGLRERLRRCQRQHRGHCRGAGNLMKSR